MTIFVLDSLSVQLDRNASPENAGPAQDLNKDDEGTQSKHECPCAVTDVVIRARLQGPRPPRAAVVSIDRLVRINVSCEVVQ